VSSVRSIAVSSQVLTPMRWAFVCCVGRTLRRRASRGCCGVVARRPGTSADAPGETRRRSRCARTPPALAASRRSAGCRARCARPQRPSGRRSAVESWVRHAGPEHCGRWCRCPLGSVSGVDAGMLRLDAASPSGTLRCSRRARGGLVALCQRTMHMVSSVAACGVADGERRRSRFGLLARRSDVRRQWCRGPFVARACCQLRSVVCACCWSAGVGTAGRLFGSKRSALRIGRQSWIRGRRGQTR
jgi:hypothetical protein